MEDYLLLVIGVASGIVGGLAGGAAVLVLAWVQPAQVCPVCDTTLPKFRKPTGVRQLLWGGWTCPACNTELDRRARKIAA